MRLNDESDINVTEPRMNMNNYLAVIAKTYSGILVLFGINLIMKN